MEILNINSYELPVVEVTQDAIDYVQKYYGFDIREVDEVERDIIVKFLNHGASAAIMDLIVKIQKQYEKEKGLMQN